MSPEGTSETRAQRLEELSAKMFSDAKLLKGILLHLPLEDLLFAQAVCKTWRTTIEQSSALQKALFFEPAGTGLVYFHKGRGELPLSDEDFFYIVPPLESSFQIVEAFETRHEQHLLPADQFKHLKRVMVAGKVLRGIASRTRVFLNPLLISKFPWFRHLVTGTPQTMRSIKVDLKKDTDLHPSARHAGASWRRMLITQPPLAIFPAFVNGHPYIPKPMLSFVWNVLGAEHWTHPVRMDVLRKEMAKMARYKLTADRTDLFESWKDGTDMVKAEKGQTPLQHQDSNKETASNGGKSDKDTMALEPPSLQEQGVGDSNAKTELPDKGVSPGEGPRVILRGDVAIVE